MTKQLFLNNFTTVFIAAVKQTPTTGTPATELDYGVLRVSDGAAGMLLNPTGGDYYVLTAYKRSGSNESSIEVMRITAVDNSTPGECRITVQRAQEGTTTRAYVSGDYLSLRFTKGSAENMVQKVAGKGLSTEDYTAAEKTKLAGIAASATANATDAALRDRSTHTGSQAISTITDLQTTLDAKLAASNGTASGLVLNDGYTEEIFAVTGTTPALSPTNGSIQTWTLTGNATPTAGTWASGQSMTLMVDDGSAYTINWASMSITWKTGGGTAPTLLTTGYTVIELVKVGSAIYGWLAGDA